MANAHQVVIVGGGVGGSALAASLAAAGVEAQPAEPTLQLGDVVLIQP